MFVCLSSNHREQSSPSSVVLLGSHLAAFSRLFYLDFNCQSSRARAFQITAWPATLVRCLKYFEACQCCIATCECLTWAFCFSRYERCLWQMKLITLQSVSINLRKSLSFRPYGVKIWFDCLRTGILNGLKCCSIFNPAPLCCSRSIWVSSSPVPYLLVSWFRWCRTS